MMGFKELLRVVERSECLQPDLLGLMQNYNRVLQGLPVVSLEPAPPPPGAASSSTSASVAVRGSDLKDGVAKNAAVASATAHAAPMAAAGVTAEGDDKVEFVAGAAPVAVEVSPARTAGNQLPLRPRLPASAETTLDGATEADDGDADMDDADSDAEQEDDGNEEDESANGDKKDGDR